jgi:hypothetical protein
MMMLQLLGLVVLLLGTWLTAHKQSFIAIANYVAESQHLQVRTMTV